MVQMKKKSTSVDSRGYTSRFVAEAMKRAHERALTNLEKNTAVANKGKTNDWDSTINITSQLFDPKIKKVEIFKPGFHRNNHHIQSNNYERSEMRSQLRSEEMMSPDRKHHISSINKDYDQHDTNTGISTNPRTTPTIRNDQVRYLYS